MDAAWRCISFALMQSVWKEQNDRIFRGTFSDGCSSFGGGLRLAKWLLARKELVDVRLNDVFYILGSLYDV